MVLLVGVAVEANTAEHMGGGGRESHRQACVQVTAGYSAYSVSSEQLTHESLPRSISPALSLTETNLHRPACLG
jgi:hypothetical protein